MISYAHWSSKMGVCHAFILFLLSWIPVRLVKYRPFKKNQRFVVCFIFFQKIQATFLYEIDFLNQKASKWSLKSARWTTNLTSAINTYSGWEDQENGGLSPFICFAIVIWTRPNEFGSMTARKDNTSPIKSIFCHWRPQTTIKRL